MWQIDGGKEFVLNWGGLISYSNTCSDTRVRYEKSAEAIVVMTSKET
jgi:hypothetical protein